MTDTITMLREAAEQFRFYETQHRDKVPGLQAQLATPLHPDTRQQLHQQYDGTLAKAAVNADMAEKIEQHIAEIAAAAEPKAVRSSDNIERPSHPELVARLQKPGEDVLAGLNPLKADILHMIVGVFGEAGELADALKKWAIYGKELDHANVVEELGDLEFFLEGIRRRLDITRDETLEGNIDKLVVRYGGTVYSDRAAIDRADKAGA